ncbi:MAG TPA: alkaline phosphatase family protein [Phycisphaerae bacterium]|nr:alkaline phosphatase family protein [Phycisphaerae bacterium]
MPHRWTAPGLLLLLTTAFAWGAASMALTNVPPPASAAPPAAEPALAHHAVIISIDGCRPDVLLRADAPRIRDMMAHGSFTMYAETTDIAITLPSHTSMLTGQPPEIHGIVWNTDDPPAEGPLHPYVPTIFQIAHAHGMTSGIAAGKKKFEALARDVDYDKVSHDAKNADDSIAANDAATIIREHAPNVMFVHFANCDIVGHAVGWGTMEQVHAIEGADAGVGTVLDALQAAHIADETLVILSSDHGGSGAMHGKGDPRSRYIPWICTGPDVRENYDLTRNRNRTIHTEDTFATACYFLGLPTGKVQGQPVLEVLHERDLMVSATRPAR